MKHIRSPGRADLYNAISVSRNTVKNLSQLINITQQFEWFYFGRIHKK